MRTKLLLGVTAVLLLTAAQEPDEDVKKERKKLEGAWRVLTCDTNGVRIPIEAFKNVVIRFEGDTITFQDGKTVYDEIVFDLAPDKKPPEIDYHYTKGIKKGVKEKGIYELAGDRLKLCVHPNGKKRPSEFGSPPGTGVQLMVLQRQKSAK